MTTPVSPAVQLDTWHILLNASLPVQAVMLVLLLLSLFSWTLIFKKIAEYNSALKGAQDFEQRFWSGGDLGRLYRELAARPKQELSGQGLIFLAGFKEFVRLRPLPGQAAGTVMEGAQRAMRVALMREQDALESKLSSLATIGSISPYVGLFGTVWGIMHSFLGLAQQSQVSLQVVAPDIAEALLATAMGLLAAIPAVMAYNRFATRADGLLSQYQAFKEEFCSILQRQAHEPMIEEAG